MSYNLEVALAERTREDKAAEERLKFERQKAVQDRDVKAFAYLDQLLQSEQFKWFQETYLEPIRAREHEFALDLSLSPTDRSDHAHRLDQCNELLDLLGVEHKKLFIQINQRPDNQ
jgi:hypothetical protein